MRRALVLALLAVLLAFDAPAPSRPARAAAPPRPQSIELRSQSLPLNPEAPAETRLGTLTYVWGARLVARGSSRFGGLSGLEVEPLRSGFAFTAVTDDGDVVRWTSDGAAPPQGAAVIRPLLDTAGAVPAGKPARDAEDLTRDEDGYVVSFEGRHRLWRYAGEGLRAFSRPATAAPAPVVERMSDNLGFEAVAHLSGPGGGATAVGAEDGRLWLCPRAGSECRLALRGPPEFGWWLTALDALPGGEGLVALYRFYNPFTKRFAAIVAYLPVRGGEASIQPLARLSSPLTLDNFEGIAVVRQGAGYRLFIVSDDDFSPERRTLLMAFDWKPQ